jgi:glucose uptake protein GlcU
MFYQWVMCTGIFIWGVGVQLVMFGIDDPLYSGKSSNEALPALTAKDLVEAASTDPYSVKFFPYAILGGFFWATGNTMSVPVINSIGLGMGMLIWGASNMLMGWATGSFGLFETTKDDLATPALNYVGVVLAVISLLTYTQVQSTTDAPKTEAGLEPLTITTATDELATPSKGDAPSAKIPRTIGIAMAVVAGILFGNTFTPPNYIMDNGWGPTGGARSLLLPRHPPPAQRWLRGAGTNSLDYVFSHFTGIYITSTFWFAVYCCLQMRKGEAPKINPNLVLPALLSGVIWAIAQTSWFVANANLGVSVAFPIITSGPGIVSAAWGVFVFGEIQGRRNFIVLSTAILIAVTGCIMIGASKS